MDKSVSLNRSKVVASLDARVQTALSVFDTYGQEVGAAVTDMLSETFAKEAKEAGIDVQQVPFFALTLKGLSDLLKHQQDALNQADLLVLKEENEDKEKLDSREASTQTSTERTRRLRMRLAADFGEAFPARLGLKGELSNHTTLKSQLTGALHVVEEQGSLPTPLDPNIPTYNLKTLQAALKSLIDTLGNEQEQIERERRQTQSAQIKRREEINKTRHALNAFNYTFEYFARLADKDEIADRLRPSGGRPTQNTPAEENTTNEPTTAPTETNQTPNPTPPTS